MTDVLSNGTERCHCRLSDRKRVTTAVLLSFLVHALAIGGALTYVESLKRMVPILAASGSGRLMVDIVRQGADERISASPRIQASGRIVNRSFKAAASRLLSERSPLVASTAPVIESEQPQAAASQPVEGLAFPQATGLDAPGRRQAFVRPSSGPVGDQSLTEDRQRWELDRQLAQQVLLRQQQLHQYLRQWMAQLRPAVTQVADFVCQVGSEVICEPILPPEVQALVEQGMAQIQAINPASGPYRLVKTNGALSFDRVTS